ncbi:putative galactose oxidase [Lupinus albus]|uniref:Putative galactose oxidase n=1 Tax=Lupinus albus TaxID=3870 RepID=A0A6A4PFT7_LUPAL|nr:putative galactose oxidase [Lupinus albus]
MRFAGINQTWLWRGIVIFPWIVAWVLVILFWLRLDTHDHHHHHEEEATKKPDIETNFIGSWELINNDSGVSAMHVNLMPTNKLIVYDATVYRISRLPYPKGVPCVPFQFNNTNLTLQDCFAHAMEYDIDTNQVRPLKVTVDPWCSSGGLAPDGTLVSTGGWNDGNKTVRYIRDSCSDCDWREHNNIFQEPRWYATQHILANGDFIVIGGRGAFSYEFVPKEGQISQKAYYLPLLYETTDFFAENNLYPFVYLIPDGNIFVFSNYRSILLNPTTNKVVKTFPILLGGSRNYPASGMSALLPIRFDYNNFSVNAIKVEMIVCGGNSPDAFVKALKKEGFLPALQDCARMIITDPNPLWDIEMMPSRRTLGDALNLPNGQILLINGAQNGTGAWWNAEEPNFTPVLYSPDKPKGQRFKGLNPNTIARMYHSSSALLPSGKIWVGGSNPHDTYKDVDKYPTETRVQSFYPPYLDPNLDKFRPLIIQDSSEKKLRYKDKFETHFSIQEGDKLSDDDIKVTMYFPPFTTHGFSMNQRLLVLKSEDIVEVEKGVSYKISSTAPPFAEVAPPGYYLLFVVHRGVPSKGMWVQI